MDIDMLFTLAFKDYALGALLLCIGGWSIWYSRTAAPEALKQRIGTRNRNVATVVAIIVTILGLLFVLLVAGAKSGK